MGKLLEDLKYALRIHTKAIAFTFVALCTLSLGIGASTAVFSVVNAVLLKPLPYPDPQRIVIPWHLAPKDVNLGYNEIPWGTSDVRDFLKMKSFESLGAFKGNSFNLTGLGEPVQIGGLQVSSGFFPALGTAPLLGRTFSNNASHGNELEAILSYQLWQERFHGDRSVLGRGIDLNGQAFTVIGVMPSGFAFPRAEEMPASFDFPRQAQVWVPLALAVVSPPGEPAELAVVARLRRGVSIGQAQAEMNLFTARMERESPESKGWFNARVTGLMAQAVGDTRKPLLLILGAVGVLLLIACANIANLLLVRALGRAGEFALRAALGAGKIRLVRQLLTESSLISLGGGAAGVLVAALGIHLLKVFGPANIPRLQEVTLDWRVLAFAFAASCLCGALFGLAPVVGSLRDDLAKQLRHTGRGANGSSPAGSRLRSAFLVAEIGLAFVLVFASGLLVRTFFHLLAVDPGFNAERALTFELSLPGTKYKDNNHIVAFYQKALRDLRTIPGVASAGIVEVVPMASAADGSLIRIPEHPAQPGKEPFANYSIASSGYFSAVGTPLLRGRVFLDSDTISSTPVVIINAAMAKKFWPGENPIGKQVGLASAEFPVMNIVGVVADVKHISLREDATPEMYVPFTQKVFPSMLAMHVVLRTTPGAGSVTGAAREAIRQLDPDMPLAEVTTLRDIVDDSLAGLRFSMLLLGVFGFLSLTLASIGLYGVISYSVSQRTREIGIRMALGAARGAVFGMVIGQGARLTAFGVLTGLLAALGVTRLMSSVLYGVPPADALTFALVAPLLAAVALLACYAPAYRAMRVDPIAALRQD